GFGRVGGGRAKTDRLEAQGLAHCASAVRPTPRPLPEEAAQQVAAVVERRRQVVARRTAQANRLGTTRGASVRARIQAPLPWREADRAEGEKDLRQPLRA